MIQLAFHAGVIFGDTYQHVFMGWLAYVKVLVWPFSREHALTCGVFSTQECRWVVGVTSQHSMSYGLM